MKKLSYLLLLGLFALATSCAEQNGSQIALQDLTEEEKAENYLVFQESPIFFGKVTMDEEGKWSNGWTVNKFGGILNHEFSADQSPASNLDISIEQMRSISQTGVGTMEVESKIELKDQVKLLRELPLDISLEKVGNEMYFGVLQTVHRNQASNPNVVFCGTGCGNDDAEEEQKFKIVYFASEVTSIENAKVDQLLTWLRGINNDLN